MTRPEQGALAGKAIVITGAGRGIGAVCALLAAHEGAKVIVNDIDPIGALETVQQIRDAGGTAAAHCCDVSRYEGADRLIAFCVEEFGAIDGLLNNAGVLRNAAIEDAREDDIRAMVSVNILGTIFCGQHALKRMCRQGSGAVVNVGSGAQNGMAHLDVYCATKGAIASLTYAWAAEVAASGVRVNAISPYAATQMMTDTEEYRKARPRLPGIRLDIPPPPPAACNAPAAIFLLSDLAGDLNGEMIRITGDAINLVGRSVDLPTVLSDANWSARAIADALPQLR